MALRPLERCFCAPMIVTWPRAHVARRVLFPLSLERSVRRLYITAAATSRHQRQKQSKGLALSEFEEVTVHRTRQRRKSSAVASAVSIEESVTLKESFPRSGDGINSSAGYTSETFQFLLTGEREKVILGIDPGFATVGVGLLSLGRDLLSCRPIHIGTITTDKKTLFQDRILSIHSKITSLLDEYSPDLVAMEKMFFSRASTTIDVAQARGVLLLALAQRGCQVVEYTAPVVKRAVTGRGNSDKGSVQRAVATHLQLDSLPKPDDASDALAIALTACFHARYCLNLPLPENGLTFNGAVEFCSKEEFVYEEEYLLEKVSLENPQA